MTSEAVAEHSESNEGAARHQARLISDEPAVTDEFGAHGRIAETIYQLIENSGGGKTVALEGRWGSGKSSVVRMLREKCRTGNTLVFQYDAWVHAGDPLRRAFLSSLIDFLREEKWLENVAAWMQELEVLGGKRKESEKTSSPLLTKFGFFLAIAVLLVPSGASAIVKAIEFATEHRTVFFGGWNQFLFWFGLLAMLGPVFLCLGNILYCRCRGVRRPNYLAVLLNKQTTTESTTLVESGDQSTIEFQKVFGDLLTAALSKDSSRKLVLVIDNLDRVEASEVADIWSLLKSFIDIPRFSTEPWHARLWVMVPIAVEAELRSPDSGTQKQFDAAFLDKIFQARFRLPPPILKRWRPYLSGLLRTSLPSISDSDVDVISDLVMASFGDLRLPIPRELVLFVNQLAIFAEQWGQLIHCALAPPTFLIESRIVCSD